MFLLKIKYGSILFYGEEDYNIEQEIGKLKKGLDKNFLEMSFKTYDNPKFPDLISILRSQPMMFGKMLIVINCLDYFQKLLKIKRLRRLKKLLKETVKTLILSLLHSYRETRVKNLTAVKNCLNF